MSVIHVALDFPLIFYGNVKKGTQKLFSIFNRLPLFPSHQII